MLDKAEYSAFESTLNSSIVSHRIIYTVSRRVQVSARAYVTDELCQVADVDKGGATVLKVGVDPPPYDYLGGTEINMVVLNLLIGMA